MSKDIKQVLIIWTLAFIAAVGVGAYITVSVNAMADDHAASAHIPFTSDPVTPGDPESYKNTVGQCPFYENAGEKGCVVPPNLTCNADWSKCEPKDQTAKPCDPAASAEANSGCYNNGYENTPAQPKTDPIPYVSNDPALVGTPPTDDVNYGMPAGWTPDK